MVKIMLHFSCYHVVTSHNTFPLFSTLGTLVAKYQPDYATNLVGATNTGAQASLCVGIILGGLGLMNLGTFIHFISHPGKFRWHE